MAGYQTDINSLMKNGVTLQIQNAFQEQNWTVLARLAEKRYRETKEQYYYILKEIAKGLSESGARGRIAAQMAIRQFLEDDINVQDIASLNLLDFSTRDVRDQRFFPEVLGPLIVRSVKAAPQTEELQKWALDACINHWDLVSAQAIGAFMDRTRSARRPMFVSIILTHLLAMDSQTPPGKRALYGSLALKQIQKAAEAGEQMEQDKSTSSTKMASGRVVGKEQEVLLLYELVKQHGKPEDLQKLITSPLFSPAAQFSKLHKTAFLQIIRRLSLLKEYETVFGVVSPLLSTTESFVSAVDWRTLQQFFHSAAGLVHSQPDVRDNVFSTIENLLTDRENMPRTHQCMIDLADAQSKFLFNNDVDDHLPTAEQTDSLDFDSSTRLGALCNWIVRYADLPSCLDAVKELLQKLPPACIRYIAFKMAPNIHKRFDDSKPKARTRFLEKQLQFFALSCPSMYTVVGAGKPKYKCHICASENPSPSCSACLTQLTKATVLLGLKLKPSNPEAEAGVQSDASILNAFCNLRIAFVNLGRRTSWLHPDALRHIVHATLILEKERADGSENPNVPLLLSLLHIFLGSGQRARENWNSLGVKRSIIDSLAPLFYDRLSTVSPAIISSSDLEGSKCIGTLKQPYASALGLPMPKKTIEGFNCESWTSVIGVSEYINNLRTSATRAMSLVEEARAERLFGKPLGDVLSDPRFLDVRNDTVLKEVVDYGSFPSWEHSDCPIIPLCLSIGPPLSNARAHLSLAAEGFHDLLTTKFPSSKALTVEEQRSIVLTLNDLSHAISQKLRKVQSVCTPSEFAYFQLIGILCTILLRCIQTARSSTVAEEIAPLADSVTVSLKTIRGILPTVEKDDVASVVTGLSSFHRLTLLRDCATATKLAVRFANAANESEKRRDRATHRPFPARLNALLKQMSVDSDVTMQQGGAWLADLKKAVVGEPLFEQRFVAWVFRGTTEGRQDLVGRQGVALLVGSWKANLRGWQQVRWD